MHFTAFTLPEKIDIGFFDQHAVLEKS